jgi:hypothetical protein
MIDLQSLVRKSKLFRKHTFTTTPDVDPNFSKDTENTVRNFLDQHPSPSVRKTNHHEIGWIIRHLKFRKAAGPDGIQNIVLKTTPTTLKFIATIYNASIGNNYCPSQWKFAKIIMLPEPDKDHYSPFNYSQISLLNSLSNLSYLRLKVLLKRLNLKLKELSLIRDDQYSPQLLSRKSLSGLHQIRINP